MADDTPYECVCGSTLFEAPTQYVIRGGQPHEVRVDGSRWVRCVRCLRRIELLSDGTIGAIMLRGS
jgi:hypothetical protein